MRTLVLLLAVGCYDAPPGAASGDAGEPDGRADAAPDAEPAGCVVDVAAGGNHSCAVRADHSVWCWGGAEGGVLANASASTVENTVPLPVEGLTIAPDHLSLGHYLSAAWSDADGLVHAWGRNGDREIDGSGDDPASPRAVAGLGPVQSFEAGYFVACAVSAGAVACWGDDDWGQLGRGEIGDEGGLATTLPIASAVAAGEDFACAVVQDGAVACFGRNLHGRLGEPEDLSPTCTSADGVAGPCRTTPHVVPGLDPAVAVTAGGEHVCALSREGAVRCWGANGEGQLGDGGLSSRAAPAPVGIPARVLEIAAGNLHSCALLADGTVRCWGDNQLGQLGNGTRTDALTPVEVSGLDRVVHISSDARSDHTCALRADGTAVCWGENNDGELGVGNDVTQDLPVAPLLPCGS